MNESPANTDGSFGDPFMAVRREISSWQKKHALLRLEESAWGAELYMVMLANQEFVAMQSMQLFPEEKAAPWTAGKAGDWEQLPEPETAKCQEQIREWDLPSPELNYDPLSWHDLEGSSASICAPPLLSVA